MSCPLSLYFSFIIDIGKLLGITFTSICIKIEAKCVNPLKLPALPCAIPISTAVLFENVFLLSTIEIKSIKYFKIPEKLPLYSDIIKINSCAGIRYFSRILFA